MGLGKTFIGSEKAISLGKNILVVCQKSKIDDWVNHFLEHYSSDQFPYMACDLTTKKGLDTFLYDVSSNYEFNVIGVINYDLIWRRPELAELSNFTLLLDESSLIQNDTSKRSKFILNKLNPSNVILLSGTPVSGKYELIWSQCKLLGWPISKDLFYRQYIVYERTDEGYPIIVGYKNVERLKRKLRSYGAVFKKTDEVMDLPVQNFVDVKVDESAEFKKFKKNRIH